jgi:hypothetical protein
VAFHAADRRDSQVFHQHGPGGQALMKWTEVQEIAIQLSDAHPDVDPTKVNFVDLMKLGDGAAGVRRRSEALRRAHSRGHPAGLDRGSRVALSKGFACRIFWALKPGVSVRRADSRFRRFCRAGRAGREYGQPLRLYAPVRGLAEALHENLTRPAWTGGDRFSVQPVRRAGARRRRRASPVFAS